MQEELRLRVLKIKKELGMTYVFISDNSEEYYEKAYFCRWRQGNQLCLLNLSQCNALDKFLLSKGY